MTQPSKIRKALKPALYISAVAVALLLLAAIAVWTFFPSEKAKEMIVAELSKRLGCQVSIATVSVGFYPDAEIVAKNINVTDAETSTKLAVINKIRLDPNLWQLLKGNYKIESIKIDSPSILITRTAGGSWTLPTPPPSARLKETAPSKQNGSMEIGDIDIRNGRMRLRDEASGFETRVTRINGTVDPKNDEVYLDSALAAIPGMDMRISGKVSRFSEPNDLSFQATASGHLTKSGPFENAAFLEPQKGGVLADFTVKASGSPRAISIGSELSATPGGLKKTPVKVKLAGTLRAKEATLAIDSLEASSAQSSVSLAGSCTDLWSDKRSARLEGTADFAPGEFLPTLNAEGIATANINVAASMYKIDMKTDIDLARTAFDIPNLMRKESGTKSSLAANAHFQIPDKLKPDAIIIDDFVLAVEEARIKGTGRLNTVAEPRAQFSISADGFPLAMLDRMPSVDFEDGNLDLSVDVQTDRTRKGIEYNGEGAVRDALLQLKNLSEAVQIYDLRVDFETGKANAKCDSAVFADSKCSFDVTITDFSQPVIVGWLRADTLDLEKVAGAFAGPGDGSAVEKEESVPQQVDAQPAFSADILIEADSLKAGNLRTGPLKTTMISTDGGYVFENIQADVFEGTIAGLARLDPSPQGLFWSTEFEGQGMRLKAISKALQEGEPKYQGALSASGNLNGLAASEIKDTLGSMEGALQLSVADGEIREYLFLKNIIMLMQFSPTTMLLPGVREIALLNTAVDAVKTGGRSLDPTRIQFSKIGGSFQIKDGVAHTEDLRLESGLANLLFKGDIDLGKNQLDMRVRATPLGSVGSLMGKVPVAGKALEKSKETVLSTDFIARGPISNPEVKLAVVDKIAPDKQKQQE